MSSTTYHSSGSGLDRKSLKAPDPFMVAVSGFFKRILQNTGGLIAGLVILLAVGTGIAFWIHQKENKSQEGRNALYHAEKILLSEKTALLPKVEDGKAKKEDAKAAEQASEKLAAVEFKKLDVDTQFKQAIAQLKEVDEKFSRTRAAFEARIQLGSLYFQHGESAKALPWFEKAVKTSPTRFDEAVAYSSVGYAYENLGKFNDAIQAFRKALKLGEGSLKGDLLLAVARSYEALHDSANARITYDQISVDLPNTDYSRSAEIAKSRLQ